MGWFGADVHGMGARQSIPGVHCLMAAIWSAMRTVSRQPGRAGLQSNGRRSIPGVGLADSIRSKSDPCRRWTLHPARHPRDTGVQQAARRAQCRPHADADRHQRTSKGNPSVRIRAMAEQAPFYIFTAFIFSYGTETLHVSRNFLLTAVLSASVLSFVSIPLFGHLSDRIGRKNMYMIGAVTTGVFGFVYFAMLHVGSEPIIFLAIILSLVPHDMLYGPQAALIAESFTGRLRYSGSSLGYQLASVIAGGPAPLIATWLFGTYHSTTAIAIYIAICAIITLVATALMTDYTGKDISGEYAQR